MHSLRIKIAVLVGMDIVLGYLALGVALAIRHWSPEGWRVAYLGHAYPFLFIFICWIGIFYIAGLYDPRQLRNGWAYLQTLTTTMIINAGIAAGFFYIIPGFGITPKRNLFLVVILYGIGQIWWRKFYSRLVLFRNPATPIIIVASKTIGEELKKALDSTPQLGYKCVGLIATEDLAEPDLKAMAFSVSCALVIPRHLQHSPTTGQWLYEQMVQGREIYDVPTFYEFIFRKVPLEEIDPGWFLEHTGQNNRLYYSYKGILEWAMAAILQIVLLPLEVLIAALIRLTSPGPAIYRQVRVGEKGACFTLYKFRTMRQDAEAEGGAKWSTGPQDPRITPFGKILRSTHLDELPQLINILKGQISFVGPRPERPEFVRALRQQIPFYDIRHCVRPGITGWAQVSFRYGSSVEDSFEKLQYDLFYLKRASLIMDWAIIVRTVKSFFINHN